MIRYYKETDGDYLCIDTSTNSYYLSVLGRDYFEGRAVAISGLPNSICTTAISRDYLKEKCKQVAKSKVPKEWLNWM